MRTVPKRRVAVRKPPPGQPRVYYIAASSQAAARRFFRHVHVYVRDVLSAHAFRTAMTMIMLAMDVCGNCR